MFYQIWHAIKSYLSSIKFIFKHRLYSYFFITGIISVVLAIIVISIVYFISDDLLLLLLQLTPWTISNRILELTFTSITGIILIITALFLYKHIIVLLVGPFLSPLSEKVEAILLGRPIKKPTSLTDQSYQLIRGLKIALISLGKELLFTLPLLILTFIPFIGIGAAILIFMIQGYYAGIGATDYYNERHRDVRSTFAYAKKNRWAVTGIGAGYLGLLFIPFIGLFISPVVSCVAGTISAVEHDKNKEIVM